MQNFLVSVIVPVYNVEPYIDKCVRSIQKQTWQNLEILLIDDGSADRSGILCDRYARKDPRIRVIHKENGGLSDARNCGIDLANGEYFLFVDSDDWIDEDMVELLLKLAVREQAEVAECSYRSIYQDHVEEETACSGELITADGVYAMFCQLRWRYFKSVAWNKLYHRKLFADGKRYPKGRYHEDEFLTHQIFYAAEKLVYLDVSKYNYVREREGSITGQLSSKILDGCYALRERVAFAEEKKLGELTDDIKNIYCYILFDRIYRCRKASIMDARMEQLLDMVRKEKEQALSWNLTEENKKLYSILCDSCELFAASYQNPQVMQETYERLRQD